MTVGWLSYEPYALPIADTVDLTVLLLNPSAAWTAHDYSKSRLPSQRLCLVSMQHCEYYCPSSFMTSYGGVGFQFAAFSIVPLSSVTLRARSLRQLTPSRH